MGLQIEVGPVGDAFKLVPLLLLVFALGEETVLNVDGAFRVVGELFARLFASADQKEGMTAFLERREPSFTGQ